jgi:sterol carrier protein 2
MRPKVVTNLFRAVYEVGMTGVPIYNVNNNCATGSTALHIAKNLVEGGGYDCVMVLGFEKMERGSLSMKFPDRTNPLDKIFLRSEELIKVEGNPPFAPKLFGNAGM